MRISVNRRPADRLFPMLFDIALACAPIAVALPAVVAVLSTDASYTPKSHMQKRLYGLLLLAEKLPAGSLGKRQITRDIDRQTVHLAYLAQYPHRATELLHVALIAVGLIGLFVSYYLFLWAEAPLLYLLAFLALEVLAVLWFVLALDNFAANDTRCHDLFARLGAPDDLIRPHSDLFRRMGHHDVDATLRRAADVRDREDTAMTTVEAVNAALALSAHRGTHAWDIRAHTHRMPWHEFRARAKTAEAHGLTFAAKSYDWLLQYLLGPFFRVRLSYIDDRERHRVGRAEITGDVYKAAWLHTHYRNERSRLADHWTYLHKARDPLLRWAGDGAIERLRQSGTEPITLTSFVVTT
jgi:hypothetical protein